MDRRHVLVFGFILTVLSAGAMAWRIIIEVDNTNHGTSHSELAPNVTLIVLGTIWSFIGVWLCLDGCRLRRMEHAKAAATAGIRRLELARAEAIQMSEQYQEAHEKF